MPGSNWSGGYAASGGLTLPTTASTTARLPPCRRNSWGRRRLRLRVMRRKRIAHEVGHWIDKRHVGPVWHRSKKHLSRFRYDGPYQLRHHNEFERKGQVRLNLPNAVPRSRPLQETFPLHRVAGDLRGSQASRIPCD
jgi:hypothetical protein